MINPTLLLVFVKFYAINIPLICYQLVLYFVVIYKSRASPLKEKTPK